MTFNVPPPLYPWGLFTWGLFTSETERSMGMAEGILYGADSRENLLYLALSTK